MPRVTLRDRRPHPTGLGPVGILVLGGVLVAVILQLHPIIGLPLPAQVTWWQDGEGVLDETPAYLGEDAPQSVEFPASEFAALAEPAPEVRQPREEVVEYAIQPGDTLLTIAEEFGLRAETLVWANDIDDPDLIVTGHRLRVPPLDGVFYAVRPGDGLQAIAVRFGIDLGVVMSHNRIDDADSVQVGNQLFVPGARPLASGASEGAGDAVAFAAEDLPLPDNLDAILASGWLQATNESWLVNSLGRRIHAVPPSARLERVGGMLGGRVQVRDPGDGRTRQAVTGWVPAVSVQPGRAPSPRELPRGYPPNTRMDIAHVFVPYRTQLDGGPWALANCGPTSLSMVLETFGVSMSPAEVRPKVLSAQGMGGNGSGTLLTALAKVAENYGLQALDLYYKGEINRWTLDEIRDHLKLGHPIIAQVYYRRLPGNEGVAYFADHYVVITGILDDGFLYNDPINHDGPGWDRVISGERLRAAMDASDTRFKYAAFAAVRG